jgi:hypothetical protein
MELKVAMVGGWMMPSNTSRQTELTPNLNILMKVKTEVATLNQEALKIPHMLTFRAVAPRALLRLLMSDLYQSLSTLQVGLDIAVESSVTVDNLWTMVFF